MLFRSWPRRVGELDAAGWAGECQKQPKFGRSRVAVLISFAACLVAVLNPPSHQLPIWLSRPYSLNASDVGGGNPSAVLGSLACDHLARYQPRGKNSGIFSLGSESCEWGREAIERKCSGQVGLRMDSGLSGGAECGRTWFSGPDGLDPSYKEWKCGSEGVEVRRA